MKRTWQKYKVQTIDYQSSEFPKNLKQLTDCPKKIFFRGTWRSQLFDKTISIVGSRRMSRYGSEVIKEWMGAFVMEKLTVVSGFMYGVDTKAHEECLNAGGKTVAVLGFGHNHLTPAANESIYCRIIENGGLMISEFPPEQEATRWTFPQRNRIVACLATLGILVVEAGIKSGSMITANYGLKYKKNVWAVPGWVTSEYSEGTNQLIKLNLAKIATSPKDIIANYNEMRQERLFEEMDSQDRLILLAAGKEGNTIDNIAKLLKSSVDVVAARVSIMQLRGLIKEEMGKYYY